MNILTDEEIKAIDPDGLAEGFARAIEAAVLSKLAEQDVEPVGYINAANIQHLERGVLQSNVRIKRNPERHTVPLYTETQYIAAQQRTAEACAKVCVKFTADMCGDAIRNGEWREHL